MYPNKFWKPKDDFLTLKPILNSRLKTNCIFFSFYNIINCRARLSKGFGMTVTELWQLGMVMSQSRLINIVAESSDLPSLGYQREQQ